MGEREKREWAKQKSLESEPVMVKMKQTLYSCVYVSTHMYLSPSILMHIIYAVYAHLNVVILLAMKIN